MTLPESFFPPFIAMCGRLQCEPLDLLAVAANESGLNPAAFNVGGRAAGLWQMTPVAAPGMRWDPANTRGFAALSAEMQLPYWERYFAPHRGNLVSKAAAYVCTYLPALLDLAGDPDALLCSENGRTHASQSFSRAQVISWYTGNLGFDPKRTGEIRVHQLTEAIDRSCAALGHVWTDAVAAINAARQTPRDAPVAALDNAPVFSSPEPPDRDPEAA